MLLENKLVQDCEESEVITPYFKTQRYYWTCPECCMSTDFTLDEVESEFIDSDLRNPSYEMWICPSCGCIAEELLVRPIVIVGEDSQEYKIVSDGTFIYLVDSEDIKWRIN